MKCPHCNHFIPWFKVWLISRWTFIKCKNCDKRFGRNIDLQFLAISGMLYLGWLIPFGILSLSTKLQAFHPALVAFLICMLIWAPFVMWADAATIKLVSVDKNNEKSEKND